MAYKLLLVNGDASARGALARHLALFGEPEIVEAGSAADALQHLAGESFDALVVDAALPDMSGGEVCWLARRRGVATPMLVLGDERESTLVLALESGADDYLGRPFGPSALLARLRLQLRRSPRGEMTACPGRFVFFSDTQLAGEFEAHRPMSTWIAGPSPRAEAVSAERSAP